MTALTIAGARCLVEASAGSSVCGPNLTPFIAPADNALPDLRLTLRRADGPLPPSGEPTRVTATDGGFEFRRPQGLLRANADFTVCEALLDPVPTEPFTGQPWLMLALWGHVTHHDGLFLHGACCELDGRHVLLLGERQAGKSTLARLALAAGAACLTDEYPFVRREQGRLIAHGSPWPGMQGPWTALSGPLAAVFYLRHAPENVLTLLPPAAAAQRLVTNNRFFTWSPATLPVAFALLDQMAREVPVYDYGFVPDASAVDEMRRVL